MSVEITQADWTDADWQCVDEFEDTLSVQLPSYLRDKLAEYFAKHRSTSTEEVERLTKALTEIERRTGLLIHQNTGRWDNRVEHDRRTVDVLTSNQRIARTALGATSHVE